MAPRATAADAEEVLDLDLIRSQHTLKPKVLKIKGHRFELPKRLTMADIQSLGKLLAGNATQVTEGMDALMVALFKDDLAAAAALITSDELLMILGRFYGTSMGESPASSVS